MLPCSGCAYRENINGNAHIRCNRLWTAETLLPLLNAAHVTERTAQWFRFPLNYDPVWGPDECAQRSETLDPSQVAKPNPLADLLSMLG